LLAKSDVPARQNEAAFVADVAKKQMAHHAPRDMAVLCRTTADAVAVYEALEQGEVPATLKVKRRLSEVDVYDDAVALLRAFDQPDDDLAIYGAMRSGVFGCSTADIRALREAAQGTPAIKALVDLPLTGRSDQVRRAFLALSLHARHQPRQALLATLLGQSELGQHAVLFAPVLECLAATDGLDLALGDVIERLADVAVDVVRGASDGVEVLTIHAAKGLEWKTVIFPFVGRRFEVGKKRGEILSIPEGTTVIGGWPEDPLTAALALEQRRRAREEELRLVYVAMTRARDQLVMVGTANKKTPVGPAREQTCLLDVLRVIYDFDCSQPGEQQSVGSNADLIVRGVLPDS
jgi:ATP-dependent helicase/nuclease subunit A